MLEYPNKAENIDEYYQRIKELQPIALYSIHRKKFESAFDYWDKYGQYESIESLNIKSTSAIHSIVSYFTYSWQTSNYIISKQISNEISSRSEFDESKVANTYSESMMVTLAYQSGIIGEDMKEDLESNMQSNRNLFVHSENVFDVLNRKEAGELAEQADKTDSIICSLCEEVYDDKPISILHNMGISEGIISQESIGKTESVDNMTTLLLHSQLYELENYFQEQLPEEINEFLSKEDIINEIESRGYNPSRIKDYEPPQLNISNPRVSGQHKNPNRLIISDVEIGRRLLLPDSKKTCEVDVELSDREYDGSINDKLLDINYGVKVEDSTIWSNSESLNDQDNKFLRTKEFKIPIEITDAEDLILDIEFFVVGIYGDSSYTAKRKMNFLNVQEFYEEIAVLQIILNEISEQEQGSKEHTKSCIEYIKRAHSILNKLEIVLDMDLTPNAKQTLPDDHRKLYNRLNQYNSAISKVDSLIKGGDN